MSAEVGDTVTYTFAVSHATGSDGTPVSAITVVDDIAGTATLDTQTGGDTDLLLEAGETWTYTTTYTVLATDPDPLVNTVTVEGTDEDNDPVTATDNHSLPIGAPVIEVVKTADVKSAEVGDTVTYTFTVSHATASDGTPVSAITVIDDIAGAATLDTQTGGDTDHCSKQAKPGPTPPPTPSSQPTPTHSSTSSPSKEPTKTTTRSPPPTTTASPSAHPHPGRQNRRREPAEVGDTVTYTFTVSHAGIGQHTGLGDHSGRRHRRRRDARHPNRWRHRPLLEAGETWTYTATYTVFATDPDPLVNTVDVRNRRRRRPGHRDRQPQPPDRRTRHRSGENRRRRVR